MWVGWPGLVESPEITGSLSGRTITTRGPEAERNRKGGESRVTWQRYSPASALL